MAIPKLVAVSFSGLERRKVCKSHEMGVEGSLFSIMIMGGGTEVKFQLGPLLFRDIYFDGHVFIHLFYKCLRAGYPVPETSDRVESDR